MSKDKIRIGIIGAGPNGIASAMPLLKHKNKFDVTIISSGQSLFSDKIMKIQNYLKSVDRDKQHRFWEEKKGNSKNLIPKKTFFGSDDVYKDIEDDLVKSKELDFDVSHSLGGLSNVWGATVTGLSENDLNNYNYSNDFSEQLSNITKVFPVSGFKDDIDLNAPYNINYNSVSLNYCSQAHQIIDIYNNNKKFFKNHKIRLGYSKLAIQTDKGINNNLCINSGLEMYGCHMNSIFNAFFFLETIKSDINLIENTTIKEIIHNKESIHLLGENKNNEIINLNFDKVIIAAGTINTSKLVLKLLNEYNCKTLTIKDSQKYFFLYFTLFKSKKNEEKNTIGLSQIFMQTEIKNHTIQLQLYHATLLLRDAINRVFPKFLSELLLKSFHFIISRIMIGVVYFPEEISNYMKIFYNKEQKSFFIQEEKNKKFSSKYIFLLYMRLNKLLFKLKCFPLPIFIRSKVGVSQHFGSSLPPNKNPTIGTTNINGELFPFKNIYISDSSSLDRIASTPPTFISMSNAYRIAENIVNET